MTPNQPHRTAAYGFDIETDTATDGLDPATSRVTAVAVAGPGWVRTFAGPERQLLGDVDRFLTRLPAGNLVSWNGATFDFPFLRDRALAARVPLGLQLWADRSIHLPHGPLAGHHTAYRVRWWRHDHIDAYQELRPTAHRLSGSARLKVFARLHGIDCVQHDYDQLADLSPQHLADYVASDAAATLQLAERYGLTGSLLPAAGSRSSVEAGVAGQEPAGRTSR